MRNAVLCGMCVGLLGLTALSSTGGAQGTSNAAPQCAPAGQEQANTRPPGGLLRDELPWLATGMSREQVALVLQPCVQVEGAAQPIQAARQPVEAPGAAPSVSPTQRR